MASDPLMTHQEEFTAIEVLGLTTWNALQDAGETGLARQLLTATLRLEHYTSLLPHAVGDRSDDQLRQQQVLREILDELLVLSSAALRAAEED